MALGILDVSIGLIIGMPLLPNAISNLFLPIPSLTVTMFVRICLVSSLLMYSASFAEELTTVSQSDISFSCQSSAPPIWNRIKSPDSMQNIAVGINKTPRFKDDRYAPWHRALCLIFMCEIALANTKRIVL